MAVIDGFIDIFTDSLAEVVFRKSKNGSMYVIFKKMKPIGILFFSLVFFFPPRGAATAIDLQWQKILDYRKKRKQAFNLHLKHKQQQRLQRLSDVDEQKKLRKIKKIQTERARRQFKRKTEIFSMISYQNFLKNRDLKKERSEKARQKYSQIQKQLKRIQNNSQYQIDERKEFDLLHPSRKRPSNSSQLSENPKRINLQVPERKKKGRSSPFEGIESL